MPDLVSHQVPAQVLVSIESLLPSTTARASHSSALPSKGRNGDGDDYFPFLCSISRLSPSTGIELAHRACQPKGGPVLLSWFGFGDRRLPRPIHSWLFISTSQECIYN